MFNFWHTLYLAQVRAYVYVTSDSTTFMRYRGDGIVAIPYIAGC